VSQRFAEIPRLRSARNDKKGLSIFNPSERMAESQIGRAADSRPLRGYRHLRLGGSMY
jgi:hypothetical protein